MNNINDLIRKFIKNEGKVTKPAVHSYIHSLMDMLEVPLERQAEVIQMMEMLDALRPSTVRDKHRVQLAKEHLKEIKRQTRSLEERNRILEERIKVLEESK